MNISPINTYNYYNNFAYKQNYNSHFYLRQTQPEFKGGISSAEKEIQRVEYLLRIIGNKFADLFESKKIKNITKNMAEITPQTTERYLTQLNMISRFYASNKCIDVNIEDKILEGLAKKGDSIIFIMNHSKQTEDPSMLAVLNMLLAEAYQKAGKTDSFPLPKIILNQDILKTMNATKRKAFEAFGAVGVDASVKGGDKGVNTRAFLPLMKDFIKNKCNIFIFPEGRLAIRHDLPMEARFQSGVAEIVNKILGIKKEVTVVPVGFSYGKGENKGLNGMHIGTPITFTRPSKNTTTTTAGLIPVSEFADEGFAKFFKEHSDEEHITITEHGIPVTSSQVTDFIKSILCENLEICSKEAQKKILNSTEEPLIMV